MAQIRAIQARGLLNNLARAATAAGATLREALIAAQDAVLTGTFKQGRIFISTSGGGNSSSFLIPNSLTAGFSQERVAEQYQEFLEIYTDAVTAGSITDASDNATALAVMLADDRLQSVTARGLDLTALRFGRSGVSA